ncbi:MAG: helix-hairpin-helix domain-containing protein [Rhodothermales bacterium]|nr:helix-hairpin-helix domain-containing protein [Rhodothermales bacterium]
MGWQRHYYRLQQRLALTRRETHSLALVLLFLAGGLAIRHLRYHLLPYDPAYYAEIDRLAAAQPATAADTSMTPRPAPYTTVLDSTRPVAADPPAERPSSGNQVPFHTVRINSATAAELERLPRIGPKTAERIVAFRDTNGPFRRPEDLMLIRGIGEKTFEGLRAYVVVD